MSIYFFYPSRIVGGAELLFTRVANALANNATGGVQSNCNNIGYIDFIDGSMQTCLDSKISRLDSTKKLYLAPDSIIILPPASLFNLPQINCTNLKFLFWNLHPTEHEWARYSFGGVGAEFIKYFYLKIDSKNALACMDWQTESSLREFLQPNAINPAIIPVMLENCEFKIKHKLLNENELNIAWVGRLSSEKTYGLINLMDNLAQINLEQKIILHIIGEGNCAHWIPKHYNFEVRYLGTISPLKLDSYLSENIDLGFAMGTSMLEFEKLGIPCGMIYISYEKVDYNSFLWSFELPKFMLGCFYGFDNIGLNAPNLAEFIGAFLNNMEGLSKRARGHFEIFCLDKNLSTFLSIANKSIYDLSDYKNDLSALPAARKAYKKAQRKAKLKRKLKRLLPFLK